MGRLYDPHRDEAATDYAVARPDVVRSQKCTCQHCQFASTPQESKNAASLDFSGYMECHHISGDHHDNSASNLAIVCPLCHQIHHIGIALRQDRGEFIWCPSLTQEQLNHLLIGVFVAMRRRGALGDAAARVYSLLQGFAAPAKERYPYINDRSVIVPVLVRMEEEKLSIEQRLQMLSGLRFLARPQPFERHIEYWAAKCLCPGPAWEREWNLVEQQVQQKVV